MDALSLLAAQSAHASAVTDSTPRTEPITTPDWLVQQATALAGQAQNETSGTANDDDDDDAAKMQVDEEPADDDDAAPVLAELLHDSDGDDTEHTHLHQEPRESSKRDEDPAGLIRTALSTLLSPPIHAAARAQRDLASAVDLLGKWDAARCRTSGAAFETVFAKHWPAHDVDAQLLDVQEDTHDTVLTAAAHSAASDRAPIRLAGRRKERQSDDQQGNNPIRLLSAKQWLEQLTVLYSAATVECFQNIKNRMLVCDDTARSLDSVRREVYNAAEMWDEQVLSEGLQILQRLQTIRKAAALSTEGDHEVRQLGQHVSHLMLAALESMLGLGGAARGLVSQDAATMQPLVDQCASLRRLISRHTDTAGTTSSSTQRVSLSQRLVPQLRQALQQVVESMPSEPKAETNARCTALEMHLESLNRESTAVSDSFVALIKPLKAATVIVAQPGAAAGESKSASASEIVCTALRAVNQHCSSLIKTVLRAQAQPVTAKAVSTALHQLYPCPDVRIGSVVTAATAPCLLALAGRTSGTPVDCDQAESSAAAIKDAASQLPVVRKALTRLQHLQAEAQTCAEDVGIIAADLAQLQAAAGNTNSATICSDTSLRGRSTQLTKSRDESAPSSTEVAGRTQLLEELVQVRVGAVQSFELAVARSEGMLAKALHALSSSCTQDHQSQVAGAVAAILSQVEGLCDQSSAMLQSVQRRAQMYHEAALDAKKLELLVEERRVVVGELQQLREKAAGFFRGLDKFRGRTAGVPPQGAVAEADVQDLLSHLDAKVRATGPTATTDESPLQLGLYRLHGDTAWCRH